MSYLNSPRLTFSGQFQADPSTVNNDPTHFDNANFKESYQKYATPTDPNGWWNPDGTGNWRFLGCTITSVTYLDGTTTSDPGRDPIIGMSVLDTDTRTAGKIVDLDSQQQMVSELWGFVVRIADHEGNNVMRGDYEVAPFINIWFNRSVDLSASSGAAAVYQSVIKNITWNNGRFDSRYLSELREVSAGQLSINFTVDRYNSNKNAPDFTLGRIAGSIGPSSPAEPKHFTLGRQLFPDTPNTNFATAIIDQKLKQAVLDFGNSLQCSTGGIVNEKRDLWLGIENSTQTTSSFTEIGRIDYLAPDWYKKTAGICAFPLTDDLMALAQKFPLVVMSVVSTPDDVFSPERTITYAPVLTESAEYVRADQFVFRLDPQDICSIDFYATNLGNPIPNATVCIQDATATVLAQQPPAPGTPPLPPVGFPALAAFPDAASVAAGASQPTTVVTDKNGKATLRFTAPDPGNPRVYIDGQIYGLSYNLSNQQFSNGNQQNFISLLIFSGPPATGFTPTWDNFIQPIMQQYANLYPLMSKGIFNLANKEVVDKNAQLLKLVFSKDPYDANYMPATRDLSAYKKKVILEYLDSVIDAPTETIELYNKKP